ncbi:MAG: phage tail protein [Rhodoblastus sp.]|nr:MAG: phage tail protein [Rhodoblastus sp.]
MATVTGLLITNAGQAKIAADISGGADLVLTQVAWGDAGGAPYDPVPSQTALVGEKYRAPIASVAVVDNAIIIDAILPADTPDAQGRASHGFQVAECGLFDAAGTLIALARMGNGYKPAPTSGQAIVATYRLKLSVANPAALTVVVDPQAQIALGREVRPQWLTVDGVANVPPVSPAQGATYAIGQAPSGAWTGFAGRIAQWIGVWSLASAPNGHRVNDHSRAESDPLRELKLINGAWVSAAATAGAYGVTRLATDAEAEASLADDVALTPRRQRATMIIDAAVSYTVYGPGADFPI